MTTMTLTGWQGALRTYRIDGASESFEMPRVYSASRDGNVITGKASKSDVAAIERAVAAHNCAQTRTAAPAGGRRLALVRDCAGLATGKSWTCTVDTMDRHQVSPEWVGEQVCYVYG